MLRYLGVFSLITLLVLIKGGTLAYVSLAWSAIAFSVFVFFQLNNKKSLLNNSDRGIKYNINVLSNAFSLLILFQFWQLIQLVLGVSQNVQASTDTLILGCGFIAFILCMSQYRWSQSKKKLLIESIIVLGVAQALYGLWVFFTQANQILWMEKIFYLDKPTGTFVNANHFCAYLSLIIILLVSYVVCISRNRRSSNNIGGCTGFIHLIERMYSPLGLAFVLMLFTILATRSIGGVGSLLIVFGIASITLLRKNISKIQLFLCIVIILSIISIIILNSNYSIFIDEVRNLQFTFNRRMALSQAGVIMVLDNWFSGVGGGAFYSSFSQYRDLNVGNSFYHFAHNDYLQFWAEYGVIGVSILLTMLIQCLRFNLKLLTVSKNVYRRTFAYASVYSTLFLSIHSLVDFPLQIPGYTILYLAILFFNVMTYKKHAL